MRRNIMIGVGILVVSFVIWLGFKIFSGPNEPKTPPATTTTTISAPAPTTIPATVASAPAPIAPATVGAGLINSDTAAGSNGGSRSKSAIQQIKEEKLAEKISAKNQQIKEKKGELTIAKIEAKNENPRDLSLQNTRDRKVLVLAGELDVLNAELVILEDTKK